MERSVLAFVGRPEKLFSLAVNPAAYFRVQHVERQRAVPQHLIVKGAEVEFVAELLSGLFSQLQKAHLPLKMSSVCWNEGAFVAYGEFILFGFLASARMVGRNVNRPGIDRRDR